MNPNSKKAIIFSVIESLSGYNISDDSVYEEEFIGKKCDDVRATLIRDEFKTNKTIDESYYQVVCCLEVKCQPQGCNVPGLGFIASEDMIFYVEFPKLIMGIGELNIKYLGLPSLTDDFNRKSLSGFISGTAAQWTGQNIFYTLIGNKAYIRNLTTDGLKYVCAILALQNPEDACDYDEENDYPVTDAYKLELLVKKDILSTLGIPPDFNQDSNPDINTQTKAKR